MTTGRPSEQSALLARAYFLALRCTGRPELAEEAVQEAWVRLLRAPAPAPGAPEETVRLLRLVREAAVDLLRSEAARGRREGAYAMNMATSRPATEAGGAAESRELGAAARAALAALPDELRLAVSLCCEQGLSQAAAGEILEMSQRDVSRAVETGLARLRRELERSGFAAAAPATLAAVLGSIGLPAPPAALEKLVFDGAAAQGTGASAPAAAAKGGIAMKVVLGAVLAGALAGGAALLFGPPTAHRLPPTGLASPPAAPPVSGPPKKEHYALAMGKNYLDGPKLEAMCMGRSLSFDAEGNGFMLAGWAMGSIRVIRAEDGEVETVSGDNKWNTDFDLAEGPAAFLPEMTTHARAMAVAFTYLKVSGAPLKGEDQGCVYAGVQGSPYKVYKNKEKGGRWWFKRLGTPGGAALPAAVGKTAAIKDCNLTGAEIGNGFVVSKGCYYSYDEAKGEAVCLLSLADYESKVVHPNPKYKGSLGIPDQIVLGKDGSFYLQHYNHCYPEGIIAKVSPDRSRVEVIAWSHHGPANFDGPALDSGYFGGPYIPGGVVLDEGVVPVGVIDGNCIRRIKDGRTSKLFLKDGEWHETKGWVEGGLGFKHWEPGPDGRSVYVQQPGEESGGDVRIFKISPIDFLKPTVGPKLEGK